MQDLIEAFCFFSVLGIEIKTSHLLGRYSTTWVIHSAFFFLLSLFLKLGLTFCSGQSGLWSSCLCFPNSWDDRCVSPQPGFINRYGVMWTFLPSWPWTVILPISASQVARISRLSHQPMGNWSLLYLILYICTSYLDFLIIKIEFDLGRASSPEFKIL
jgi:hypothetical protein